MLYGALGTIKPLLNSHMPTVFCNKHRSAGNDIADDFNGIHPIDLQSMGIQKEFLVGLKGPVYEHV